MESAGMETPTGEAAGEGGVEGAAIETELDFSKKRRKKPPRSTEPAPCAGGMAGGGEAEGGEKAEDGGERSGGPRPDAQEDQLGSAELSDEAQSEAPSSRPQDGTASDGGLYAYSFLLTRLRDALSVDQPSHPSLRSEKQRSHVPPPKLARVGGRRVAICNFGTICTALHRSPEHVQSFLLSELATTGAMDAAAESLTLLAALQAKQAEQLLKKYVQEYVLCAQCRALETRIVKAKGRAEVLRCSCCSAERLLTPIKGGFIAVRRGERRANRGQ